MASRNPRLAPCGLRCGGGPSFFNSLPDRNPSGDARRRDLHRVPRESPRFNAQSNPPLRYAPVGMDCTSFDAHAPSSPIPLSTRRCAMTRAEKNPLLIWNSVIWISAMVLPFFLNLTLGSTQFPWPILLPLLLIGFLLYSNNVLSKVIGEPIDSAATGTTSRNQCVGIHSFLTRPLFQVIHDDGYCRPMPPRIADALASTTGKTADTTIQTLDPKRRATRWGGASCVEAIEFTQRNDIGPAAFRMRGPESDFVFVHPGDQRVEGALAPALLTDVDWAGVSLASSAASRSISRPRFSCSIDRCRYCTVSSIESA
jgi:hypothetical protein